MKDSATVSASPPGFLQGVSGTANDLFGMGFDPTYTLVQRRLVALDVQQQVVRLVNLGDRVRELASAPIFLAVDLAVGAFDHVAITLHHRGHLLALVRMDQKHNFVVSQ